MSIDQKEALYGSQNVINDDHTIVDAIFVCKHCELGRYLDWCCVGWLARLYDILSCVHFYFLCGSTKQWWLVVYTRPQLLRHSLTIWYHAWDRLKCVQPLFVINGTWRPLFPVILKVWQIARNLRRSLRTCNENSAHSPISQMHTSDSMHYANRQICQSNQKDPAKLNMERVHSTTILSHTLKWCKGLSRLVLL